MARGRNMRTRIQIACSSAILTHRRPACKKVKARRRSQSTLQGRKWGHPNAYKASLCQTGTIWQRPWTSLRRILRTCNHFTSKVETAFSAASKQSSCLSTKSFWRISGLCFKTRCSCRSSNRPTNQAPRPQNSSSSWLSYVLRSSFMSSLSRKNILPSNCLRTSWKRSNSKPR